MSDAACETQIFSASFMGDAKAVRGVVLKLCGFIDILTGCGIMIALNLISG